MNNRPLNQRAVDILVHVNGGMRVAWTWERMMAKTAADVYREHYGRWLPGFLVDFDAPIPTEKVTDQLWRLN